MKLLNLDQNPKTVKGQKWGYRTAILYLAPHKLSGYNTCPQATAGCSAACLNTAGFGGIYKSVQESRIRKTKMFYEDRANFMLQLEKEIANFVAKTKKEARRKHKKIIPCIRLNGTSDIQWETVSFVGADKKRYKNMMERFPYIQFYDYTKIWKRTKKTLPENYHLTFSLAEDNDLNAKKALKSGTNVAVVFRKSLPVVYWGTTVINADETDLRFLDGTGVICGLKAKGKARKDTSGFVRDKDA